MFESKSSYSNPLANRIADSAHLLESFATDMIQKNQPRLVKIGKVLLRTIFPMTNFVEGMRDLLRHKGIHTDGSPEEQASHLLLSLIEDVHQFTMEYHTEQINTNVKLPALYEAPIDRVDLINAVEQSVKVIDLLEDIITDPDLAEIFKIVVPQNFECESTEELTRLKEFISSFQTNIKKKVNQDIPEYLFQLMGEYWDIRFGDDIIRLKDSKGLKYIHSLLNNPYQPIRSDSLTAPHVNVNTASRDDAASQVMEKEAAKVRYAPDEVYVEMTNNIKELEEILLELTPGSDEYFLAEEHIKAERKKRSNYFNRAGQERPHDDGEKARQAVYTAITTAKKRINKNLPSLFAHLQRYLNTGFECIYDPPPSELKSWQF